jgi:hypothetical protein
MSEARPPKVRVLSVPVANVVILNSIGYKLRSHYDKLLYETMPQQIDSILQKLS